MTKTNNQTLSKKQIKKIFKQIEQGNSQALFTIFNQYIDFIFKFCFLKLKDKQKAFQVCSDLFIDLWINYNKYDAAKLESQLIINCQKRLKNLTKKNKKQKKSFNFEHFKINEQLIKFTNVFLSLPNNYQTILILRFINQLSTKQTAKIMKKSSGAIRVTQHRALKKIYKKLKK